jgi:hypothetical protein
MDDCCDTYATIWKHVSLGFKCPFCLLFSNGQICIPKTSTHPNIKSCKNKIMYSTCAIFGPPYYKIIHLDTKWKYLWPNSFVFYEPPPMGLKILYYIPTFIMRSSFLQPLPHCPKSHGRPIGMHQKRCLTRICFEEVIDGHGWHEQLWKPTWTFVYFWA